MADDRFAQRAEGPVSYVIVLCAIAWAAYVHWRVTVLPEDDAYIVFRYVQNVISGNGLTYNVGERVFGCSCPLYVLWVAALHLCLPMFDLPDLAIRSNFLLFAGAGVAVYYSLVRYTGSRIFAALVAGAFLLNREMLTISAAGMESFLFVALLIAAPLAAVAKRPKLCGVLAGLCVLTRPEGMILLPLGAIEFWRSRKDLLVAVAAFTVVTGVWGIFALLYFGSPIPQSVIAKAAPLYPLAAGDAFFRIIHLLETWTTAGHSLYLSRVQGLIVPMGLVALATLAAVGLRPARERHAWAPALLFWELVALYSIGNPLLFTWYLPPLFCCVFLTIVIGLWHIGAVAHERLRRRGRPVCLPDVAERGTAGRLVFAGVLIALLAWFIQFAYAPYRPSKWGLRAPIHDAAEDHTRLRVLAYKQAAEKLNAVAGRSDRVAAPEIGAFGFYFKGRILDPCGLVSPEAMRFLPVPPDQRGGPNVGAISRDFVAATKPEWVVTLQHFADHSLLPSEWFKDQYVQFAKVPLIKPCGASTDVLIFRRLSNEQSE